MKLQVVSYFLCATALSQYYFCWAVEISDTQNGVRGNSTVTQKTPPQRSRRRRNYCYRNLSNQLRQDQFHHLKGGVAHLVATIYDRLPSEHCQPILLSISPDNSSGTSEDNWKNEDFVELIASSWRASFHPILQFKLDLNQNPSPEEKQHLADLFLKMRRSESCYFFVIGASTFHTREQQQDTIPVLVKKLFRQAIGNGAWMLSTYFLLVNLHTSSMLQVGQWATFRNKLEIVCVQSISQKTSRLILQTFCSSCADSQERERPVLIESVDATTGKTQLLFHSQLFPNFMKKGFQLNFVKRVLRTRTPTSIERIEQLMQYRTPKWLLYEALKKSFHFNLNKVLYAWLNGYQKQGYRDYIEEIEVGGPFTMALEFTPLYSNGYDRIGFTFPYMEQRLTILTKKQPLFSKWQIIFKEIEGSLVWITLSMVVVTSGLLAGCKRRPPSHRRGIDKSSRFLLLLQWDWMIYLNGIFYSQDMFPATWKIAKSLTVIIFLVNMAGTLYTGMIRVSIATDLAVQEKAEEIQTIFQLNPNFVKKSGGLTWTGGRLETNDEIARVLPFQNARALDADKTSINLQYFYEPSSCVGQILSKERYVCVAFEEYVDLVMPSLPQDVRHALYIKTVDDLGISDWVTIAFHKDFPWANELTLWTLAVIESGLFQFWAKNMSLTIPNEGYDNEERLFESENEDVDSSQAQQEGLQRLARNFCFAVVIVVLGFFLELMVFSLKKFDWSSTLFERMYRALIAHNLDRFSWQRRTQQEGRRKLGERKRKGVITHFDFVP